VLPEGPREPLVCRRMQPEPLTVTSAAAGGRGSEDRGKPSDVRAQFGMRFLMSSVSLIRDGGLT
jgi:hypothetical protein